MFNIGFSELLLILLVAFIIVGPKDLPKVARALGRFVRWLRDMFDDFKEEMELDDTINDLKAMEKDVKDTLRKADPSVEMRKAENTVNKALNDAKYAAESKPDTKKEKKL